MDDDLERDPDGGYLMDEFGRSGKNSGEKDLRGTRVRMEDYNRRRSKSAVEKKKGKYGVTVPRPFRCAMAET